MLITRLDCDVDNVSDLSINETNMLHYMGIIEERTNTILSNYYRCKTRMQSRETESPKVKESERCNETKTGNATENCQKQQKSCDPIAVNPPKVIDYSSDENSGDEADGSRPLSIEELKAKTLSRINQPRKKTEPVPLVNRRRSSVLTRRRGSLLVTQAVSFMKNTGMGTQNENITSVVM
jgi:hypothetical protein